MRRVIIIFLLLLTQQFAASAQAGLSDDQVRQLVLRDSLAAYPGKCACPYSRSLNGSNCGKWSAWNTAGEYAPLCYPTDVDDDMLKAYRQQHGL